MLTSLAAACLLALAAPEPVDVFEARGCDPASAYDNFRIPAVALAKSSAILAFAEGRHADADQSGNDLVLRRSLDGGRTWEPLRVISHAADATLNNPQVIVLQSPHREGRLVLMHQRYEAGVGEYSKVEGKALPLTKSFVTTSDDEGLTWTPSVDVTDAVTPAGSVTVASGPGNAIQLQRGPRAGRILQPMNRREGKAWSVYAAFSDDGGSTWNHGALAPAETDGFPNEVQMVELVDGSVMLNCRLQGGKARSRGVAVSRDGGATWSPVQADPRLVDPVCMGSIIRLREPGPADSGVLAFSNPAKRDARAGGMIRFSLDDGRTWCREIRIGAEQDFFAYSSLVRLDDRRVGCLYEAKGECPVIRFGVIDVAW